MLAEPGAVLAAMGLAPETPYTVEPAGETPGAPERWAAAGRAAIVRRHYDDELAMNNAAVAEALANAGFAQTPRLLGFAGVATIEEEVPGATALQLVPPPGASEAAITAFAALHQLPLREGHDWGRTRLELFPAEDVPLHRLGFASDAREAAREPLATAHRELLASPFGFAHRDASAHNVLLGAGSAWLVNFGRAGFGPQLFDVAAFLLTSGMEAPARRALAINYARLRNLEPKATADLADLLGMLWGIHELLGLPRRIIESLGDDAATEALKLAAVRVENGIRSPAGDSPVAAAIRKALWP